MPSLLATGPNAEQITYWNEVSAPKWLRFQKVLDQQLGELGRSVMDRAAIRAGEHVLDVGCGCGDTTLELARRVGRDGSVVAIDVSTPMLERAIENARAREVANVAFWNADAQTYGLPPAAFDLVYSRFGVMFFVDPARAFSNLGRALRSGGRVSFVCWQALERNAWMAVPMAAAARVIPSPARPGPEAPGPFSFADPNRVRGILGGAGFTDVTVEGMRRCLRLEVARLWTLRSSFCWRSDPSARHCATPVRPLARGWPTRSGRRSNRSAARRACGWLLPSGSSAGSGRR
jgi:ubiquinone/menaquinone biosynthesis C-methylase UbiE